MDTASRLTRWAPRRTSATSLLTVCLLLLSGGAAATASPARTAAHPRASRALKAAGARTTRADRALVSAARALGACERSNGAGSARCSADRRAVQRAGKRLAAAERHLSHLAQATARGALSSSLAAGSVLSAPHLSVSGETLSWSAPGGARTFALRRRVAGQSPQFSIVTGTSLSPPPEPGLTVYYAVRTAVDGSSWSGRHAITYPPAKAPSEAGKPTPGEVPAGKPGPVEPPASEAPAKEPPVSEPPVTKPPPSEPPADEAAPTVSLSGQKISWSVVAGIGTYILDSDTTAHGEQFTEVNGTSVTPAAVPGTSVHYRVRTAVEGSAWSAEVTISYPAETPPSEPEPKKEPTGFQPGLNSGTNMSLDLPGAVELGAKLVRISFEVGESTAQMEPVIAAYAAKGIRVLPMASFYASMPSPSQAQGLGSWARTFGTGGTYWSSHPANAEPIQSIEFGNETSMGYQYGSGAGTSAYRERGETYARRFKEAAEAVNASGTHVGVLAQADDWTGDWVNAMFAAVPNLASYVGGWTIHPYGPGWRSRLEGLIKQTGEHGAPATIPIDITEWGLSTDNGRCLSENYGWNSCMSYSEAAQVMTSVVTEMRQMLGSRFGVFMVYQVRDQKATGASSEREAYFGALQHELQSKGAFTSAVQSVLAA